MNAPAFPFDKILRKLERWRPQILRALEAGGSLQTFDDIADAIKEVRMLYFDNDAAFAVVDIQDYTHGRVAHLLVAGGSLKGLQKLEELTTPFFRSIGVRKLTLLGRKGFMRQLPKLGWTQPMVFMEKEL